MCSYIHGKETSADIYMIRSITWFAKITIMIQDCRISLMKLEIKLVSTQSHGNRIIKQLLNTACWYRNIMVLFHSFLLTEVHFLYIKMRPTYQYYNDLGPLCKLSVSAEVAEKGPDPGTVLRQLSPSECRREELRQNGGVSHGKGQSQQVRISRTAELQARKLAPAAALAPALNSCRRTYVGKLLSLFSRIFYQQTDGWVINLIQLPHESKENHHF